MKHLSNGRYPELQGLLEMIREMIDLLPETFPEDSTRRVYPWQMSRQARWNNRYVL
jgi:hypothetical protein